MGGVGARRGAAVRMTKFEAEMKAGGSPHDQPLLSSVAAPLPPPTLMCPLPHKTGRPGQKFRRSQSISGRWSPPTRARSKRYKTSWITAWRRSWTSPRLSLTLKRRSATSESNCAFSVVMRTSQSRTSRATSHHCHRHRHQHRHRYHRHARTSLAT